MTHSVARVSSEKASRYLQQLCKHFGHKLPVEFTESDGLIKLPFGICELTAEGEQLVMRVETETADITRMEQVIGSHLERFAFREKPTISWQREA